MRGMANAPQSRDANQQPEQRLSQENAQSQLDKFDPGRPTHKYWTDISQELKDYQPRTSNYVLFNDQIIDILKKWGLVGALGGGSVNALNNRNGS